MKIEYRRKLPHKFYVGHTFFITWNLKGAIPQKIIEQIKQRRDDALQVKASSKDKTLEEKLAKESLIHREYFQVFNQHLDKAYPESPLWLKKPEIAQLVANRLHEFDHKYYYLVSYCIMANHVHAIFDFSAQIHHEEILITDTNYRQVYQVMKLINGATAVQANRILNRSGKFWADTYFDRYIRDEKHFVSAINYTLQNPVKAGICKNWEAHPFTYLSEGGIHSAIK